jgi:hypothetical protein
MCIAWFDHATFLMEARKLVVSDGVVSSKITPVCIPLFYSRYASALIHCYFSLQSLFHQNILQVPLRRTLTFKQVAEAIQTIANVREIEELTFSHIHANSQKKSRKINVLKDRQRDFRLKDMMQRARTPQGEKDDFWDFFDRDCPENFYSIEYNLKAT